MALSNDDDLLTWENTGETIKDIVYKHQLPALVKVSEGYYGDTDAETFSSGDLLKLDFVKTLIKVSASVGESDATDRRKSGNIDINNLQWSDDILIPLGYKGKLRVITNDHVSTTFHTVQELINQFPRFIRVENDVHAKSGSGKFIIAAGSELELDRVLPGQGLVCRLEEKECLLDSCDTGTYISIPDNTLYTLQEVIDKLPLPQYVKFVEREFEKVMTDRLDEALENIQNFSGVLKLQELLTHHVIVGHHKPVEQASVQSTVCERSLVLLPLESPIVNEIEVLTPSDKDTEEYEIVMTRNFSKDVNVGQVEGGLYLELRSTKPKVHRLSDIREDKPPPVPPRPNLNSPVSDKNMITIMASSTKKAAESKSESTTVPKANKSFVSSAEVTYDNSKHDYVNPDVSETTLTKKRETPNPNINRPLPLTPHQTANENIPVGTVFPQGSKSETPKFKFASLSVSELADIFEKCKLEQLAELCKSEMLDGAFFSELSDEDLKESPFNLSLIHLHKFKKIKNGWTPRQT